MKHINNLYYSKTYHNLHYSIEYNYNIGQINVGYFKMSICDRNPKNLPPKNSDSPILLDNYPIENYNQEALETATKVFNCAINAQKKIYTIHGPSSEQRGKEQFPTIYDINNGNDFYVSKNKKFLINPESSTVSIILSGIVNNTVIIYGKVNHILMRRCENIHLDIKKGTISGVDILNCKRMMIVMPHHNFTNIEYGEKIHFQAEITDTSQLHFTGSINIKINNISIPINPFTNMIFGKDGWNYKKSGEIPKLTICKC